MEQNKKRPIYFHKDMERLQEEHQREVDAGKKRALELEKELESCREKLWELESFQQEVKSQEASLKDKEAVLESREKGINEEQSKLQAAILEHHQKTSSFLAEVHQAADKVREQRLSELEKELAMLRNSFQQEIQRNLDASREESQKILEASRHCTEETLRTAEGQVQSMMEHCHSSTDKIRQDISQEADTVRSNGRMEAERIIATARTEAQELVERGRVDTSALENQVEVLKSRNAELSAENTRLDERGKTLEQEKQRLEQELQEQRLYFEEKFQKQEDDAQTERNNFDEERRRYITTMNGFETLRTQLAAHGKDVPGLTQELAAMDIQQQELNAKENELNERERILGFNEEKNEMKSRDLEERENNLDEIVRERYPEIIEAKEEEIERLKKAVDDLRSSLDTQETLVTAFENLRSQLGGKNPAEMLLDYNRVKQELTVAMEKIKNLPSYTLQVEAQELDEREQELDHRQRALKKQAEELDALNDELNLTKVENETLKIKNENLKKDNNFLSDELNRLRSAYEDPTTETERVEKINEPYIVEERERMPEHKLPKDEIEWLENIRSKIEGHGLVFPRRILHAFHTALKAAEMSPLTVLAGVSGTGKSELPRLYSHFGGINFLGVPVQPNWDCQEAMLGYYNSIDNCFEPTSILRLLAQSQRDPDDKMGLDDVMTMVLLDEMNLANVELYFAEFLSKLETRRGCDDDKLPNLGVKIGAKMDDWKLKLGRNVLWTGTMNNDETTKTLSDKVLDRGIVINFPRPKELIRFGGKTLDNPAPLLPRQVWQGWIDGRQKFEEEAIEDYKKKVEEINQQLGKTGRAIGHRVWQSIEYYMSLYPDVIHAKDDSDKKRAMDRAFEDQLVQKVMPKLRGLETRETEGDVLNAINGIIPESLQGDFRNAQQGYGQFVWTTSEYLLVDGK